MPSRVTGRASSRSRAATTANAPMRHRRVGDQVVHERAAAELSCRRRSRMSRKPACEIDEYASIRLTSVWTRRAEVPPGERDADDAPRARSSRGRSCSGNAVTRRRHGHDERGDLRRRGHERGHGRGRALVDVGRPHVERRRRGLEREPDDDHREPGDEQERASASSRGGGDVREAELAGRAVDERAAEEQRPPSRTLPTIRYSEPGLERAGSVDRRSRRGCRARSRTTRARGTSSSGSLAATKNAIPAPPRQRRV